MKVDNLPSRAVLVTGCDTGFGRQITVKLDKAGLVVFAACLTDAAVEEIRKECSDQVRPFLMDVTSDSSVDEGFEFVSNNLPKSGLWAVINNAGV